MGVQNIQELEVTNKIKQLKITTDVNEIDGIKGGSISGEDNKAYENVKYGDSSTKEIKMVPDENYEIINITVNGEEYKFTKNTDGSYTMPQFTNMTEDKHIVVTYSLKDNKITINKIDKETKAKLPGALVELAQIEERNEPNSDDIIGKLTDNGQEYTEAKLGNEMTDKLGELTNNGTYYFVKNADGTYTPTNSKTYQNANGGTEGIHSTTANSYIPIDLTGLTGTYAIVVNASCSSETNYDYGYATVTETSTAPVYDSATGRFIYVSGISNAINYNSAILEGGKTYYLHLGYKKDSSQDKNDDQVVFNSVKVLQLETSECGEPVKNSDYEFVKTSSGTYIPTNGKKYQESIGNASGIQSSRAESVIEIDLTNITGDYVIRVTANASTEKDQDYGYAMLTKDTEIIKDVSKGFIYVSGNVNSRTYFSDGNTGGNKY